MARSPTDPSTGLPSGTVAAVDFENLNGNQIQAVVDAVKLSFDEDQLAITLRQGLGKNLAELAGFGNWPVRVFKVVMESQKQGFGRELLEALEADRPKAGRIQDLRANLARLQELPIHSSSRSAQAVERDTVKFLLRGLVSIELSQTPLLSLLREYAQSPNSVNWNKVQKAVASTGDQITEMSRYLEKYDGDLIFEELQTYKMLRQTVAPKAELSQRLREMQQPTTGEEAAELSAVADYLEQLIKQKEVLEHRLAAYASGRVRES